MNQVHLCRSIPLPSTDISANRLYCLKIFVLNFIFPITLRSITWLFSPLDHLPKLIFILSGFFSPKPQILALCFSNQPQKSLPLFSHYLIIFKLSYHFHIILFFHIILLLSHYLIIVRLLSLFITLSISLSAQEKLQPRLVLGFPSFSTTTEKCPICSLFSFYLSPFFSFSAIKCSENVQLAPFFLSTFLDYVQYSSSTIFSNASEII